MNNNLLNRSMNQARWLILAMGLSLAMLWLAPTAQAAMITQTVNDTTSTTWSTDAVPWGGTKAVAGNTYVTAGGFVTATDDGLALLISGVIRDTGSIFGGDSITIVSGTELLMKGGNASTTTGNIILNGGGIRYGPNGTNPGFKVTLAGTMNVTSGGGVIGFGGNNTVTNTCTLTGSGTLSLRAASGSTVPITNIFAGTLSGFSGTLQIGFTPLATTGGGAGNLTVAFGQAYTLSSASIVMDNNVNNGSLIASTDILNLGFALTVKTFQFGATTLAAGTYTVTQLNGLVGNGSQFTGTGSLTTLSGPALTPPSITTQPTWSPATVHGLLNESTKCTVVAAGSPPLFYFWHTNSAASPALSDIANHIVGSATSVLTITNDVLADGQNYYVVITNAQGSVTSSVAALTFTAQAPSITTQPIGATLFTNANGTLKFSVAAIGTLPLTYQWFTNGTTTALSDGGNLTGSAASVLTISNANLANASGYTVKISNGSGSVTSSVANLIFTVPSGAYEAAVMTNSTAPFAFYTFSEAGNPASGTLVAQDSIGTFSGTYGINTSNSFNGIAGPRATADALVGFPDANTALRTVTNLANAYVSVPAFNLNNGVGTNVLTITAWIHPNGQMPNGAGVVFCRNGVSTISGLAYMDGTNNILGYNWANDGATFNWNSGLVPPTNIWSLAALVITPTNTTLYVINTNRMLVATVAHANALQKFDGPTFIGYESYASTRVFNGSIDEVALFGQALSQSQVTSLFSAASGIAVFPPTIATQPTWSPATVHGLVNESTKATVLAGGTAPLSYFWYTNSTATPPLSDSANHIIGSATSVLTITNDVLADGQNYYVVVTNAYGSVTSSVAPLTFTGTVPSITTQPSWVPALPFTGQTAKAAALATGTVPLSYQWFTNSTTSSLSDDANHVGSTSNVLTIAHSTVTDAANYTVVITNIYGAITSSVATLAITATNAYQSVVLAAAPFAYYALNESSANPNAGGVVAYDSVGGFNGTYGVACSNGFNDITGPRTTADGLVGFPNSNTALATVSNTANSYVTVPAFNLNNGVGTNVLTITAWVNPKTVQANNVGIVFCRAGTTVSGLDYNSSNGHLGYTWNNESGTYGWDSGITPPTNVWSLVALAVTSTNATVYILNTNGLLASTHTYTHVIQKFDGSTLIGLDNNAIGRTFNGSIDEVALFNQALSTNQMLSLFAGASGVFGFPPVITTQPSWSPATNYVGQPVSVTVNVNGSSPLSYQWFTNNTFALSDAGSLTGSTSNLLTIGSAAVANGGTYTVVVTNLYGAVTSSVAQLTILPAPTNFTLNFGGSPQVLGAGSDWNTVSKWNPLGFSAANLALTYPTSSFEVITNSLVRNPAGSTYNVFPGNSLILDGSGNTDFNGSPAGTGEIRFKNSTPAIGSTNYFSNLILNGGELNIGDSTDVILQGQITVLTNSVFGTQGASGTNQTYRVDSYLTGSGTVVLYLVNSNIFFPLPPASLNIRGNTNTFTGQWNVLQGPLLGSGTNSLGTNTITIGTGGVLETAYDINNTNGSLILNGQFFLHQNDTFQSVVVGGVALAPGTYTLAQLHSSYPTKFPTTWTQLSGSTVNTGSGSITVLSGPVIALTSSAQTNGYLGTVTFNATVQTNGVTAGNATGTVIFSNTSGSISTNSVSAGSASSASVSNLPRGTSIITVIYSGDSNYGGSTNTLSQIVTNHPPVAGNLILTRNAGIFALRLAVSDILASVTDADGDSITLAGTGVSTNGITVATAGTNYLDYYNTNNVNDQFSYTVTDGNGGTNSGLVSILVSNAVTGQITGAITSFTGGVANLEFHGIPDYSYVTERSTNLTDWVDVSTNTASTNGVISVSDSFSDLFGVPSSAYYRLKWQP